MTGADVALLVLRVALGAVYLAHGGRKLFGRTSGSGWDGWVGSIGRRGFRPAALWAAAGLGAEFVGGTLAVVGLLTPVGGALLFAQSAVIVLLVAPRGFWHTQEGVEYPLMLAVASFAVALAGPGRISLDAALGTSLPEASGPALIALALGGTIVAFVARRLPAPPGVPPR